MQEEHPNARVLGQLVYADISIDVEKIPAKIVIEQFEKDLDIDMNVYWATDTKKGLQEDALITLSLQNKPAPSLQKSYCDSIQTNVQEKEFRLRR